MLAVDREVDMPGFLHDLPVLCGRVLHVQGHDVGPRGHQHADPPVGEAEDALHHILFRLLEDAGPGGLTEQDPDVFLGDLRPGGRSHPERRKDRLGRYAQHPDDGGDDQGEEPYRARDRRCDPLGVGHGHPFWYQFADHKRQIGDGGDDGYARKRAAVWGKQGNTGKDLCKGSREGCPAESPGDDPYGGDADLDSGEELCRVLGKVEGGCSPEIAVRRLLLQARFFNRDYCEFRHRKEAVCKYQQDDDRDIGGQRHCNTLYRQES